MYASQQEVRNLTFFLVQAEEIMTVNTAVQESEEGMQILVSWIT